jgi:hypothetical protein
MLLNTGIVPARALRCHRGVISPQLRYLLRRNPGLASRCWVVKLPAIRSGAAGYEEKCREISVHREQSMSIFGKIMSAILGTSASATPAAPSASGGAAPGAGSTAKPASTTTASSAAPAAAGQTVDVAAIVDKAAAASGEKLAWRTSIVDLMKALKIDSSLTARKELAKELGYTGDMNDSASMNIWLHKQVMAKLAANGGKLPPEIKH